MPKAKSRAPPKDADPAQSEQFVKFASALGAEQGGALFDHAMHLIAKPIRLPPEVEAPIIVREKAGPNPAKLARKKKAVSDS